MQLLWPGALWISLLAAGVVLAHLVRRRARLYRVPFLPLWSAALVEHRSGFGARVGRYLDLFLVCLASIALAIAASGSFLPGEPETLRDLVLVLDGGLELRGGDRLRLLQLVAQAEVRRRAPGTRVVVVRVDEGRDIAAACPDPSQALDEVQRHKAAWTRRSPDGALTLARAAARRLRDPDLVFCTYRPGRPDGFRLRTVRRKVANAGVEALEVIGDPETGGRVARLTLRGEGPVKVDGLWEGEVDGSRTIELPLLREGRIELRVSVPRDGFGADDVARLLLPETPKPRVLVLSDRPASPFLISALQALEEIGAIQGPLERTTPDRAAEVADDYDLFVFDRCAPPERFDARALYLAPGTGALPFRVGAEAPAPNLFDLAGDHALLKGLDLERIPPLKGRAIVGGEALASGAPGALLAAGANWVALGFDPDGCVFASTPSYPLFLRNSIAYLVRAPSQARPEFYRVGERAPVSGLVHTAAGQTFRIADRLVGPPGFWEVEQEALAVNLLVSDLDLAAATEESDPLPPVGEPGTPDVSLVTLFAAIAVGLLLIAWWVFWRR